MTSVSGARVLWDDQGRGALLERATQLLNGPGRTVLGISGLPGAGKTTIAEWLVEHLLLRQPGCAALLPADGFQLAQTILERRDLTHRRGAPDTFDVDGYVETLERTRTAVDKTILVPEFRRTIQEPVAAVIEIPSTAQLVITEGNYLLLDVAPWEQVERLLDECWFVHLDDAERHRRLTARHLQYDRDPAIAEWRTRGADEHNARYAALGRDRCSVFIDTTPTSNAMTTTNAPTAELAHP